MLCTFCSLCITEWNHGRTQIWVIITNIKGGKYKNGTASGSTIGNLVPGLANTISMRKWSRKHLKSTTQNWPACTTSKNTYCRTKLVAGLKRWFRVLEHPNLAHHIKDLSCQRSHAICQATSEFSTTCRGETMAKASIIVAEAINTVFLLAIFCCKHVNSYKDGDWWSTTGIRRTQTSSGISWPDHVERALWVREAQTPKTRNQNINKIAQ